MTKIISKTVPAEDAGIDQALRPGDWEEYVGQDKIKQNLRIIIDAAKKRGEAMDHLLFCGQAGLGKTTLALLVAKEMAANVKITSGPALEKMGDMAAILTNLTATFFSSTRPIASTARSKRFFTPRWSRGNCISWWARVRAPGA